MIKNFDEWNEKKKKTHVKDIPKALHFYEREIWWCALGCNIGSEEDGKHDNFERPMLIFRKFGEDISWAIPLTTQSARYGSGKEYTFTCNGITRTADMAQMRPVSSKRLIRYVDTISYEDFQTIRKIFISLA
jgi:hypothetical protein